MTTSLLAPRSPVWFRSSLVAGGLAIVLYLIAAWVSPWHPGRIGGLTFGILGAALFFNAGLYPWRRRWRARPLGTARRWLELHVYGSAVAMLFVLLHMGWQWPAGTMGWLLLVLSSWTTATGFLGLWLQRLVPMVLARRVSIEAIYERIPELRQRLLEEADRLMSSAGDVLTRVYSTTLRPELTTARVNIGWLLGSTPAREQMLRPLVEVRSFLDETERARADDLESIVNDKVDLDAHLSLQSVLRGWLVLHVPPAIALLALLVVHVFAVLWF